MASPSQKLHGVVSQALGVHFRSQTGAHAHLYVIRKQECLVSVFGLLSSDPTLGFKRGWKDLVTAGRNPWGGWGGGLDLEPVEQTGKSAASQLCLEMWKVRIDIQ